MIFNCFHGKTCNGCEVTKCPHRKEKPVTNFERITESPEKLVEFIDKHYGGACPGNCGRCYIGRNFCFKKPRLDEPVKKAVVDWLKEESEAE